jgi:hypothetical protein
MDLAGSGEKALRDLNKRLVYKPLRLSFEVLSEPCLLLQANFCIPRSRSWKIGELVIFYFRVP